MLEARNYSRIEPGYLMVFFAAFIWGSFGLFVRALDYSPELILFFRFLFGLIGIILFAAIKRDYAWVKTALIHWKWMLLPAFLSGLSWFAYTYSLSYTSVSNAAFLIYTAPIFTVIFTPLVLKERIEGKTVRALIITFTGTAAIMGYNGLFSSGLNLWGNLIALCGAVVYGFMALALKRVPAAILGIPSNIMMSLYFVVAVAPFALSAAAGIDLTGFILLIIFGLLHQSFAVTLFHLGLRKIKAQHASILTYIEPLAATGLAALFLYEPITWGSLVGGALIIAGGIIIVFKKPQPQKAL